MRPKLILICDEGGEAAAASPRCSRIPAQAQLCRPIKNNYQLKLFVYSLLLLF